MVKLGIVMDPISAINIKKDSSFAMMLEAESRGWEIHYMELCHLYVEQGVAFADSRIVHVKNDINCWYEFTSKQTIELGQLDVILMRKDPPFDSEYIYATYILERAEIAGALIVNKPQSLRDCNEKLYTAWFPDLTPTTLVTRSAEKINAFREKHKDIIIKPLDGMGGASVFRVKPDDPNVSVIIETLTNHGQVFAMVQSFVPEISGGDKRILIIDGKAVPYCYARIPAKGETRGNLAAGARGEGRPLTASDIRIAEAVGPALKAKGLIFVGLDVIGDKLTEINVTSPTCIRQIEEQFGISITRNLMDVIEEKLAQNPKTQNQT